MDQVSNKLAKPLEIPSHLLWSFDIKKVDPQRMYKTIIEHVLERGTIEDIAEITKYYSLELVQDVTLKMKVLNPKRVNLMSLIWDIPVDQFKAWNTRDWEKIYGGFLGQRNSF